MKKKHLVRGIRKLELHAGSPIERFVMPLWIEELCERITDSWLTATPAEKPTSENCP